MTKDELTGLVVLMNSSKQLIQTKRIRIYQREKLVEKILFLIPVQYEGWDMSLFTVSLQWIGADTTIHSTTLERLSDGEGGYIDYEDASGNKTHLIFVLPVDTNLTTFAGDLTMKLNLQYVDYTGQTTSPDDQTQAPDPVGIMYVLNTDDTIVTVLPVADYYSIIPDESLSQINQKIAELDAKQRELEATAEVYDTTKADNIKLDVDDKTLYLTSHDQLVGDKIDLNDLGNATADTVLDGLVTVVL